VCVDLCDFHNIDWLVVDFKRIAYTQKAR
jgi:hypothetical protein